MAFEKPQSKLRWLVLFLACLAMFGSYYVYDNPTALHAALTSPPYSLSGTQYNWLYSIYSLPNIVLPFFGGFLVDRLGTNVTLFTFLSLITAGHAVFAIGVSANSFPIMIIGRGIFGLGGESMSVASSTLLAQWFRGKELAMAMGVNIAVARVGSVANDQVSPAVASALSVKWAIWLGFLICCMSLTSTCILIYVDVYANRKHDEEQQALLANADPNDDDAAAAKDEGPKEEVNLRDVKDFELLFWLLCGSCVIVYAAVLPFNNVASELIQFKYNYKTTRANILLGVPYAVSAALSPFLGRAVDQWGYRAVLLTVSAASLAAAHFILGFVSITPWVPMLMVGLSYSLYAASVWPSVSYVVKEHELGTAYGVITAIQNCGLFLIPLLVGSIHDKTCNPGYNPDHPFPNPKGLGCWCYTTCLHRTELFFVCVGLAGVVLGLIINYVDARTGHRLNKVHIQTGSGGADGKDGVVVLFDDSMDPNSPAFHHHSHSEGNADGDNRKLQRLPPPDIHTDDGGGSVNGNGRHGKSGYAVLRDTE